MKHQKDLEREIRNLKQAEKDRITETSKTEKLEQELASVKARQANDHIEVLKAQIKKAKHESNQEELSKLQKEYVQSQKELHLLQAAVKGRTASSEGASRIRAEQLRAKTQDKMEKQEAFQNQINDLNANGETEKADKTDKKLSQVNDDDDDEIYEVEDEDEVKKN